jgi:hypothetical protein
VYLTEPHVFPNRECEAPSDVDLWDEESTSTSILLDEQLSCFDQSDLEEEALIEALNHNQEDALATWNLLRPSKGMRQDPPLDLGSPPEPSRDHSPTEKRDLEPSTFPSKQGRSRPSQPDRAPAKHEPVRNTPTISPLSLMDPVHLNHLSRVYALGVKIQELSMSLNLMLDFRNYIENGKASSSANPMVSNKTILPPGHSTAVLIEFTFPQTLGTRQFELPIRNADILRNQRLRLKQDMKSSTQGKPDPNAAFDPPAITLSCDLQEALPVQFNAHWVDAFIEDGVQLKLNLISKTPVRSTLRKGPGKARTFEAVAEIPLRNILKAQGFHYDIHLPLFSKDRQYFGHVLLNFRLLPAFDPKEIAIANPPAETNKEDLKPPAGPLFPEPPFPIELNVQFDTFTPFVVARSMTKAYPKDETSCNLAIEVNRHLSLRLRAHVPLETSAVPWTHQMIKKSIGLATEEVQVQNKGFMVHFGAQFSIPTSMNLLQPWFQSPLIVEVWSIESGESDFVAKKDPSVPQSEGSMPCEISSGSVRSLLGIAKLPLFHILKLVLDTHTDLTWSQVFPISLNDMDCPVINPFSNEMNGWLSVGLQLAARNMQVLDDAKDFSPFVQEQDVVPEPTLRASDRDNNTKEFGNRLELPLANLLVRFHTAGGIGDLAKVVCDYLLNGIQNHAEAQDAHRINNEVNESQQVPVEMRRNQILNLKKSDQFNLYVEMEVFPKRIAEKFKIPTHKVVSPISFGYEIPLWEESDAGNELIVPLHPSLMGWLGSNIAMAHGRLFHTFVEHPNGDDGDSGVDTENSILLGEFRIDLNKLCKRSKGLCDAWVPIFPPSFVRNSKKLNLSHLTNTVGCIHISMFFIDLVPQELPYYLPLVVEFKVVATISSRIQEDPLGKPFPEHIKVEASFLEEESTFQTGPFLWCRTLEVTPALLQSILNGSLKLYVSHSVDGSSPCGFAFVDTFAVAHALLRMVNRLVDRDQVAFCSPILPAHMLEGSVLQMNGKIMLDRIDEVEPEKLAVEVEQVDQLEDLTPSSSLQEESRGIPTKSVVPAPEPSVRMEVKLEEIKGFQSIRVHAQLPLFVSFAWAPDYELGIKPSFNDSVISIGDAHGTSKIEYSTPLYHTNNGMAASSIELKSSHQITQCISIPALEKIKRKKVIIFKVWNVLPQKDFPQGDHESDVRLGFPEQQRQLLAFSKVDISPLANGFPELNGWYNLNDYSGQIRGQLHVIVRPESPLPPIPFSVPPCEASLPGQALKPAFPRIPSSQYFGLITAESSLGEVSSISMQLELENSSNASYAFSGVELSQENKLDSSSNAFLASQDEVSNFSFQDAPNGATSKLLQRDDFGKELLNHITPEASQFGFEADLLAEDLDSIHLEDCDELDLHALESDGPAIKVCKQNLQNPEISNNCVALSADSSIDKGVANDDSCHSIHDVSDLGSISLQNSVISDFQTGMPETMPPIQSPNLEITQEVSMELPIRFEEKAQQGSPYNLRNLSFPKTEEVNAVEHNPSASSPLMNLRSAKGTKAIGSLENSLTVSAKSLRERAAEIDREIQNVILRYDLRE